MRCVVSILLLAALIACGGDASTGPAGSTGGNGNKIALSGSWTGVVGPQVLALTLVESSGTVTGNGTLSNTPGGLRAVTVSGTFASPTLSATVSAGGTVQPFNIQGTVTAASITGALSGAGFSGDAITMYKAGSAMPNAATWVGAWTLATVNGSATPANFSLLGYPTTVYSRKLTLAGDGTGTWDDSTASALFCFGSTTAGQQCDASGHATLGWAVSGSQITIVRSTNQGYVVASQAFAKQADGTLLKIDSVETDVYRKQ